MEYVFTAVCCCNDTTGTLLRGNTRGPYTYLIGGGPDGVLLSANHQSLSPTRTLCSQDTHTGHNLLTSILPPLIIYSPNSSNHLIFWSIDVIPCTSQLCLLSRNMQLCSRNRTSALQVRYFPSRARQSTYLCRCDDLCADGLTLLGSCMEDDGGMTACRVWRGTLWRRESGEFRLWLWRR